MLFSCTALGCDSAVIWQLSLAQHCVITFRWEILALSNSHKQPDDGMPCLQGPTQENLIIDNVGILILLKLNQVKQIESSE